MSDLFQYEVYDETTPMPWEIQEEESAKAFAAFTQYKNMHTLRRSVRAAVIEFYGSAEASKIKTWQVWSAEYKWVARAAAWDKFLDLEVNLDLISKKKDMTTRHMSIARALQQKAVIALNKIKPEDYDIPPYLILQFIQIGTRLERLSLGEPTEIERNQSSGERDFTTYSNDELRAELSRFERVLDKASSKLFKEAEAETPE